MHCPHTTGHVTHESHIFSERRNCHAATKARPTGLDIHCNYRASTSQYERHHWWPQGVERSHGRTADARPAARHCLPLIYTNTDERETTAATAAAHATVCDSTEAVVECVNNQKEWCSIIIINDDDLIRELRNSLAPANKLQKSMPKRQDVNIIMLSRCVVRTGWAAGPTN